MYFIISFLMSLFSCYAYVKANEQKIFDEEYINSLNLPANGDSLGIQLVGAFVCSLLVFLIHVLFHSVFFPFMFFKVRRKKDTDKDFHYERRWSTFK